MAFEEGDRVVHSKHGPGVIVPRTRGTIDGVLCVLFDGKTAPRRVGAVYLTYEETSVESKKYQYALYLLDQQSPGGIVKFGPTEDTDEQVELRLSTQRWRDLGMPTVLKVVIEPGVLEPVNYTGGGGEEAEGDPKHYKDPAELFREDTRRARH